MIVPEYLTPHINTDYPKSNKLPFEEWLAQQTLPELERMFIPIHVTSYHVNNNYGQDPIAIQKLQNFFDGLDRSKKYWVAWQYDNGLLIDTKNLDIVSFGMSYRNENEKPTHVIPLIGQMPLGRLEHKRYKGNFIGSITHPIRSEVVSALNNKKEYFISTEQFRPQDYYEVMAQSEFTICPRGFGTPSFRAFEAIHNYSIPVYVSDEFAEPYGIDFNEYGVKIHSSEVGNIYHILNAFTEEEIEHKWIRMLKLKKDLTTYEGVFNRIIKILQDGQNA